MADAPLAPTRPLGDTGVLVSPLCLGGNVFGWTADRDASFAVLDAYAEAGGNFIDTADVYSSWVPGNAGGESETIIGEWMRLRGNRDAMVIATKVAKLASRPGLSPDNIRAAAEDSLTRLGTDRIDLYYAHQDDPSVAIEDTLAAFDGLVREGAVRHIAASNFTAPRLQESLAVSAREGWASYVALQNHYNLMERQDYETHLAPVVAEHDLASLPFYGLARGFLTGKYRPGTVVDSPRAEAAGAYAGPRGDRVITALERIAAERGATTAAVALAWLLSRPGITAPIASARSVDQLGALLSLASLHLTPEERAALDSASAGT